MSSPLDLPLSLELSSTTSNTTTTPAPEQRQPPPSPPAVEPTRPTGRRQEFSNIERELSEQELAKPGTLKLLLAMLDSAEADRNEYKAALSRRQAEYDRLLRKYWAKIASIRSLNAQLRSNIAIDLMAGGGIALGGLLAGFATSFKDSLPLWATIGIGLGLMVASVVGAAIGKTRPTRGARKQ